MPWGERGGLGKVYELGDEDVGKQRFSAGETGDGKGRFWMDMDMFR
jgi:hypothetical protein